MSNSTLDNRCCSKYCAAIKPKDENRLPLYSKLAFAVGNFINVLAVSMWFPYNVSFFQKVLQLPPSSAGTIVLIAQIGGAVSTPFIGIWSDSCRCRIPGQHKVFQLIGILSVACSFFFIWHDCLSCTSAPVQYQVLYYSCFAIVFEFGWAATQIGQLSLIPILTSDKNTKVELNSIRYSFQIIANLIVFGCFWGLLDNFNSSVDVADLSPHDKEIFWVMAIVVIVLGLPVSLLFQFFVYEDPSVLTVKLRWYRWLINPKFYLACVGYTAARMIVILPQTYLPLYFTDTLNMDKTSIAKGPLFLYISSFVSTLVIKRFSKLIGDKMSFFLGLSVVWGALIWFWVKDPSDDPLSGFNWNRDSIYGAAILLGAGGAVVLVISMAMVAYLVGEYTGSSAFVYGWVAFSDRLSNGVAVKVIQQLRPSTSLLLPNFYRNVVVFVPFVGTGLGLLTITSLLLLEWRHKRKYSLELNTTIQNESSGDKTDHLSECVGPVAIVTTYEAVDTHSNDTLTSNRSKYI